MGKKKKDGIYHEVTLLNTFLELYECKLLYWFFTALLNLFNYEG